MRQLNSSLVERSCLLKQHITEQYLSCKEMLLLTLKSYRLNTCFSIWLPFCLRKTRGAPAQEIQFICVGKKSSLTAQICSLQRWTDCCFLHESKTRVSPRPYGQIAPIQHILDLTRKFREDLCRINCLCRWILFISLHQRHDILISGWILNNHSDTSSWWEQHVMNIQIVSVWFPKERKTTGNNFKPKQTCRLVLNLVG